MKTKDLIAQLNAADPSGEEEVFIDGITDILTVYADHMYWDGCPQQFIRSPDGHVIGGKIRCQGTKIKIIHHSLEDATLGNADLPIDLSELEAHWPLKHKQYVDTVQEWRNEVRAIKAKIEAERNVPKTE